MLLERLAINLNMFANAYTWMAWVYAPRTSSHLSTEKPNGEITEYRIYDEATAPSPIYTGVTTEFEYLRLQPYTNYTLSLEACTSAGCAASDWQIVTTAEIQPENQAPPTIGDVNSTAVTLRCVSDSFTNEWCIEKFFCVLPTVCYAIINISWSIPLCGLSPRLRSFKTVDEYFPVAISVANNRKLTKWTLMIWSQNWRWFFYRYQEIGQ